MAATDRLPRWVARALLANAVLPLACVGAVDGRGDAERASETPPPATRPPGATGPVKPPSPGAGEPEAGEPAPERPPPAPPAPAFPGAAPLRRLTAAEYDNTVRDLLGDTTRPGTGFPPDPVVSGFDNDARALVVSPALTEDYLHAAEGLAARAMAKLEALAPCASRADAACATEFITRFGKRAFRRPLEAEEIARLEGVFRAASTRRGFTGGIEVVLRTLLVSAPFLYRMELGTPTGPGGTRVLTSYELASRLSYLLWGTMPDDRLFAEADRDALRDPTVIAREAQRMIADPRAKVMTASFHTQWLGLDALDRLEKDKGVFPKYTNELRALFRKEAGAFVEAAAFGPGAFLGALHTTARASVNPTLARYYGLPGPTGGGFKTVDLDPSRQAGLLSLGSVAALLAHPDQTSPTLRGRFVRERLLCQPLPPPPPTVNNNAPALDAAKTTRERYAAHATDPSCSGCHELMDPIGFAFERLDGAGVLRETEAGRPIDTRGEAVGTDLGKFDGTVELGRKLAASGQARACLAQQWFRYAYGRDPEPADEGSLQTLTAALSAPDANVPKLLLALTQTDVFLGRTGGRP